MRRWTLITLIVLLIALVAVALYQIGLATSGQPRFPGPSPTPAGP